MEGDEIDADMEGQDWSGGYATGKHSWSGWSDEGASPYGWKKRDEGDSPHAAPTAPVVAALSVFAAPSPSPAPVAVPAPATPSLVSLAAASSVEAQAWKAELSGKAEAVLVPTGLKLVDVQTETVSFLLTDPESSQAPLSQFMMAAGNEDAIKKLERKWQNKQTSKAKTASRARLQWMTKVGLNHCDNHKQ